MSRAKSVYLVKLAEKAQRYDEMAEHMNEVIAFPQELSVEERNLLLAAYKNLVSSRRASLRLVTGIERHENSRGNETHGNFAREYRAKVEGELQEVCETIVGLLETSLIPRATTGESKVFYHKMKADYYRYIAEFALGDAKSNAAEKARLAYEEAQKAAEMEMSITHPCRLGLALNHSIFLYDVLQDEAAACKMARTVFADAVSKLDDVGEDIYKDITSIMHLLRDNLLVWTAAD